VLTHPIVGEVECLRRIDDSRALHTFLRPADRQALAVLGLCGDRNVSKEFSGDAWFSRLLRDIHAKLDNKPAPVPQSWMLRCVWTIRTLGVSRFPRRWPIQLPIRRAGLRRATPGPGQFGNIGVFHEVEIALGQ
jgi:hypothetical protein